MPFFQSFESGLWYNFIVDGFFDDVSKEYKLTEDKDSGKSEIIFPCKSEKNLCISNFDGDGKPTILPFFKGDADLHLRKRVDHVIFELNQNQKFDVHLIEMKTTVGSKTWIEVKGKFRASYLTVKAIAAILDYEIENFCFYTTYEKVSLESKKENTVTRKARLGQAAIRPEEEWAGNKFGLNIGDRLSFKHKPIQMTRNSDGILIQKT